MACICCSKSKESFLGSYYYSLGATTDAATHLFCATCDIEFVLCSNPACLKFIPKSNGMKEMEERRATKFSCIDTNTIAFFCSSKCDNEEKAFKRTGFRQKIELKD